MSFFSFLHTRVAGRLAVSCSTPYAHGLSRRLPAACIILVSLLLSLPMNAKEWYGEAIEANKNFYLYNIGTGQFLTNTGAMTNEPKDAAIWVFSSTSSGTIKTGSNGINFTPPKIANFETEASWSGTTFATLTVNSSPSTFTINGSSNQYVFSVIKTYGKLSPRTYYRYIASDGSKFFSPAENTTEVTQWYLISETQMKQHISVSTNSLDFGSPAYNDSPVSRTFTVTYTYPTNITFEVKGGDSKAQNCLTISPSPYNISSTFGEQEITVTFKPEDIVDLSGVKITVAANGNTNGKHIETITLKGNVLPLYFEPEWLISDFLHYDSENLDTIAKPVTLPTTITGMGIGISNIETTDENILKPFCKDGEWYVAVAGEGMATLNVVTSSTEEVKSTNTTKTITVSPLMQQTIKWDTNYEQMLTYSSKPLDAKAVDSEGVETGCTISYALGDNAYGLVSKNGTQLTSEGNTGATTITATVAPCNGYAGATMTKTVKVSSVESGCTQGTQPLNNLNTNVNKDNHPSQVGLVCPKSITITSTKSSSTKQPWILQEQRSNGAWETVLAQLDAVTNQTIDLHIDATAVRIKSAANNNHTLSNVTYIASQYAKYPAGEDITMRTTIGAMAQSTIAIDWCNGSYYATVDNPNFSVTQDYFGSCGNYGTKNLKITYKPTEQHPESSPETAQLKIFLYGSDSPKATINLKGIADKLLQQITKWEVPATAKTTDVINLNTGNRKPITDTGLKSFTFAIVSGVDVATIDAHTGEMTIIKDGEVEVQVTEAGNDIYQSVSATRTITISKVDLTCTETPTASAIIEGQSLASSDLTDGIFKFGDNVITGSLAWEDNTIVPTTSGANYNVVFTPSNANWYNKLIVSIPVTMLKKPTFDCAPTTYDFGAVSVVESATTEVVLSNINMQGQANAEWKYEIIGSNFYVTSLGADNKCIIKFSPSESVTYNATLTIWAEYEYDGIKVASDKQSISLSGTGTIPAAGIGISGNGDFGDIYGTTQVSHNIDISFVSVANLNSSSFTWKNNSNIKDVVSLSYSFDGTYQSVGANLGKLVLTAGVSSSVSATTSYSDVLVVSSTKTDDGRTTITAELPVNVTIHPKKANTLELNVVADGKKGLKAKMEGSNVLYYYIYIDETNVPLFKAGTQNNTTSTISVAPTSPANYATYLQVNGDHTLSPLTANKNQDITIEINQSATDEFEGYSKTINVRVIKHTPIISIHGLEETATANKYYAWRHHTHEDFVHSTSDGEITVGCYTRSDTSYISFERVGSCTWNFTTINKEKSSIRLSIKQKETTNYEAIENTSYYIQISKDPRHVSINYPDKQMWENTKPGLNGQLFTMNVTNAEFVGDQWDATTFKWTGSTQWTNGGNDYGSTTAIVIKDGGSVTYSFTGIPLQCYFRQRYAGNAASGGTFKVEESNDGNTWTAVGTRTANGGQWYSIKGTSKFIRISYDKGSTDKEWVEVHNILISERTVLRSETKFVTCEQDEETGEYADAQFTLQTANWGVGGIVELSKSNNAFSYTFSQPEGNGVDDYREIVVTVSYNKALANGSTIGTLVLKNDTTTKNASTGKWNDSIIISMQAVAAVTKMIVPENADRTGLKTGTVAGPSTNVSYAFHRGLSDIDLSHCFDAAGNALFDRLYVFGITNATNGSIITAKYTNSDGSGDTNIGTPRINVPTTSTTRGENYDFNATTRCYVYLKSGDKSYTYSKSESFDATQKRFDHGSSLNGKKLYFTGYCPFAYMGTNPSEMGWMYFTGGNKDGVDIYLEDCEIMGRYKTASGCGNTKDYEYNEVEITIGENWLTTGCSSIFVFKSNQTASGIYTPKIHILGNNHLKGQAGSLISKVIGTVGPISVDAGINATGTASAPISILSDGNEGITNLIFDDIWANNDTTNGFLKLDATSQQVGIADLGSTKGTLTFNGGQYNVRNSAADGQYTCNIMACYRAYTKTVAGQNITLYGLGADQPAGCKVTINSGTFTMTKNMQQISSKDYNGGDYYIDQENFMDLRLPGNSIVNGGTFNGINEVVRCTSTTSQGSRPLNQEGAYLCKYTYDPHEAGTVTTLSNGAITCNLPQEVKVLVNGNEVTYPYLYTYDNQKLATNALDATDGFSYYGGQSLNLDTDGNINLLLNSKIFDANYQCISYICEELAQIVFEQWAACTPSATASSSNVNQSGGFTGETTVQSDTIDGVVYKTNRLLYAEMDENITKGSYKDGDISIEFTNEHGEIVNEKDYTIHKELVSMVAVKADRWMAFVAPFDIYEVRIIEAADEDTLALKYSNDKAGALAYQATENICFSYKLANYVVKDLAGGRTTSMSFNDLAGMCIRNMAYDAKQSKYNRGYYTLDHYDGSNIMTANYYLYEIDNEKDTCIFPTDGTGTALEIKWKPVATKASAARADSSALMKKGHVYAIQFPYCPMCNDVDTRTTYDYWTGKLIVFHGTGPQKVSGTNRQAAITSATAEAGKAVLTGNYTFANLSAPAGIYAHNTKNDLFERTSSATTIKPMQGYMLFSSPIANATALSISRAGRISYEYDSDITTDDHIPTIGSRASMLVYRTDNGFAVDPVRTQRVMLYNLNGQLLFNGTLTEGERHGFNLTQGIYLLKGEEEIIKVMVN